MKKNERKRNYYMALFVLCVNMSLTSCSAQLKTYSNVNYEEENYMETSISYEDIKNLKVIAYRVQDRIQIYLVRKQNFRLDYYDVLKGIRICDTSSSGIVGISSFAEFLIYYDVVKRSYTLNEMEEILSCIKNDFEVSNNRKLILKKKEENENE